MPARLGILVLNGLDDADPDLAVPLLENPIEGYEGGLFELGSFADGETERGGEGYCIWKWVDEDYVVFGRVELGSECGGDAYSRRASTDDDDVLGGHFRNIKRVLVSWDLPASPSAFYIDEEEAGMST